jgi:membrane protease YdiL (CAAX protease family)
MHKIDNAIRRWTLLRIFVYVVGIATPVVLFEWGTHFWVPEAPSPYHAPIRAALNLVGPLLALLAYRALVRRFEDRGAVELSFRPASYASGIVIGFAAIVGSYAVLWGLGVAQFAPGRIGADFAPALVGYFCVGVIEELVARVVIFRLIEEMGGTLVAVVMSGLLFGLAHAPNDHATIASSLCIAEAGVMLALAFATTRNLWLTAGIHFGWNFSEGEIFGGAVSGIEAKRAMIKTVLTGPDYLTGGAFGLEASVATVVVIGALCLILWRVVAARGNWRVSRFGWRPACQPD